MSLVERVFQGNVVWSNGPQDLIFKENYLVAVSTDGTILFMEDASQLSILQEKFSFGLDKVKVLSAEQFLIPGFIDTHIHAPQYVFTGTGYDRPLLEWLNTYTFPRESEFKSDDYATDSFGKVVHRSLACGSTTACYFGTIHTSACKILANTAIKYGQRAFIGKVNMDRNSPDYYVESTEESIEATRQFVEFCLELKNTLVTPVVTPRFVPTCTPKLMTFLGEFASKYNLQIQSHISENKDEIEWVKSLHPECESYSEVYESYKLLTSKTIMAHCIHLSQEELDLFKRNQVGIAHCPNSNFSLSSGICNVREMLDMGITKVGLGTDVGGGYSPCVLDSMRQAAIASKVAAMTIGNNKQKPLNLAELLYLGTLGGARALNIQETVGNFQVSKEFDALLVSIEDEFDRNIHVFPHDTFETLVEKFVYLGDDRNIKQVFVKGCQVK